jgi:hypothetical protein
MGTLLGLIAAVLLLACLLLSGSGCSHQSPSSSSPAVVSPPVVTTAAGMKSLDRAAIRASLKRLANTPAPKQTVMGAMCYKPASMVHRADYVCPKCGERTLYDDSAPNSSNPPKQWLAFLVANEIPSCRREFAELRKLAGGAVAFDESQFCRKCSPKVATPKLLLHISYIGEKARDVNDVKHGDLRILHDFLAGNLLTKGDNDSVDPLKNSLPRLCVVLGVKSDEVLNAAPKGHGATGR